jgi:hypothetical protein
MDKYETINRTAVVIIPKEPFWDWVNSVEPESTSELTPEIKEEGTVYLFPEFDESEEMDKHFQTIFRDMFENELMAWFTDESLWPRNRDWKMFKEWFDHKIHDVVWDTLADDIEKE